MCIVLIANKINRNVYMYLKTRIFPTTGYARVLLFMFIRRELGGTGTGCLFQFTYCVIEPQHEIFNNVVHVWATSKSSDQTAHTRSMVRAFVSRLDNL